MTLLLKDLMRNIIRLLFVTWVVMWVIFTIRPILKNSLISEYSQLFGKPLDERRAIVYGKGLCAFLKSAKDAMPVGATYAIEGFEEGSVDIVRAEYYLYPCVQSKYPQYVLTLNDGKYSIRKSNT